jgi:hypothetical protein
MPHPNFTSLSTLYYGNLSFRSSRLRGGWQVSGERICSFSVENQAPSADILNILPLAFGYRNTLHINFFWQLTISK